MGGSTGTVGVVDAAGHFILQKGMVGMVDGGGGGSLGNGHFENWGESGMADNNSQQTDTSTDVDTDDKNQVFFSPTVFSQQIATTVFLC